MNLLFPTLNRTLLLFVLRRPELKDDESFYSETLRLPIDVRIKGLSVYCREFDQPLDTSDNRFKAFHFSYESAQ